VPKITLSPDFNRANFVQVEIEVALTYCVMAQERGGARRLELIQTARRAYDNAQRHMFDLDMGDKEFQQVAAVAERVRFMLQALEN
jgi:DNA primase